VELVEKMEQDDVGRAIRLVEDERRGLRVVHENLKRSIHIKNLPNEKSLAKTNKDINK
jgi:hypothetical protein